MTIQEAHMIIGNYMEQFHTHIETAWMPEYSKSLDALVPVWKRLEQSIYVDWNVSNPINSTFGLNYEGLISGVCNSRSGDITIQEAAAIATAKTIQEIEANND